jgi:hypothetical protein
MYTTTYERGHQKHCESSSDSLHGMHEICQPQYATTLAQAGMQLTRLPDLSLVMCARQLVATHQLRPAVTSLAGHHKAGH